ncbi:MAG: alpha/beta hydrolase [Lysinibacillus sp.]
MTLLQLPSQYIERVQQRPSLAKLTPTQARKLKKKEISQIQSPVLQFVKDHSIKMRDGANITIRIYRPKTMRQLPIIIYYHGGGWVINDINTSHESCVQLAQKTEHIVVSVDYRLAPEYKFPTPLHDAFDAFLWVVQNRELLHSNGQISVAGDSAGGNLAAAVALLAKEQQLKISSQILLYPVTNLQFNTQSYEAYQSGYGLDREVMKWFGKHYINDVDDYSNPLVSPLLADVANLPSTFIVAAQYDVLHDEAVAFAEKLRVSNVDVELHEAPGLVHSYFTNNDLFKHEIAATIDKIANFLYMTEQYEHKGA